MGLKDIVTGVMGSARPIDGEEGKQILRNILVPGERVVHAYRLMRDSVVFTDYRLIIQDVQGATGKRTSYKSIPYSNIRYLGIETPGSVLDFDSELYIRVSSSVEPSVKLQFKRGDSIYHVQRALAEYTLGIGE